MSVDVAATLSENQKRVSDEGKLRKSKGRVTDKMCDQIMKDCSPSEKKRIHDAAQKRLKPTTVRAGARPAAAPKRDNIMKKALTKENNIYLVRQSPGKEMSLGRNNQIRKIKFNWSAMIGAPHGDIPFIYRSVGQ